MKLNIKRTFFMGFAFFAILMLWQMYNYYCPLFLKNWFGDQQYIIGLIMAADNIFAIFMLPIFGALSDKTNSKWGKRMPYMVIGMFASAIVFPLIAVMFYLNTVVGVIVMMGVILAIMNVYRNPAVALMPDVTPKPLRSQANGIINLVGYIGAVLGGAIALVLGFIWPIKEKVDGVDVILYNNLKPNALVAFIIASIFMIIALVLLIININEKKIQAEVAKDMEEGEKLSEQLEHTEDGKLSKADKKNTIVLLFSVLFWFISFNAVESFYSIFCAEHFSAWVGTVVMAGLPLSSIITFLLAMNLPVRIGRKNCVLIGLGAIILGFGVVVFQGIFKNYNDIIFVLAIIFCGVGWALINANSYPMLVEVSDKDHIGKYTGLYYTFSMIAQSITPVLAGYLMYFVKPDILFLYSFDTMIIAAVIFSFFKENKHAKIEEKKGLEGLDVDD